LLPDELDLLSNESGATRLGFAVMLRFAARTKPRSTNVGLSLPRRFWLASLAANVPRPTLITETKVRPRRWFDAVESVVELVGEAHEEAKLALAEIRDLIRGIHPAVLTARGLDAAISALAGRSPFPWKYISTNARRRPWRSPHTSSSPKPSPILPGTPKLPESTSTYAARKLLTNGSGGAELCSTVPARSFAECNGLLTRGHPPVPSAREWQASTIYLQ
jgi:hypothetical protein